MNQINLLKSLADKIRGEEKTKENVLNSLQKAKILNKNGDFTKYFKNLRFRQKKKKVSGVERA